MPAFKKSKKKIPLRPPEMLVRDPRNRDADTYGQRAPGLYPDETLVELEDGATVAVSVERHWIANGAGLAFHAYARAIGDDGATELAPNDEHLESCVTYHCPALLLEKYGEQAIADDMARLVLGEDPKLVRDVPVEDGQPPMSAPVVDLGGEGRLNGSIRFQMRAAKASAKHTIRL